MRRILWVFLLLIEGSLFSVFAEDYACDPAYEPLRYQRAIERVQVGAYDEARELFLVLYLCHPERSRYICWLAKTEALMGDFAQADRWMQQAVKEHPLDEDVLLTQATILFWEKKYEASLHLAETLTVSPERNALLVKDYLALDRAERAYAIWVQYRDLEPATAWQLAGALEENYQFQEAQRIYLTHWSKPFSAEVTRALWKVGKNLKPRFQMVSDYTFFNETDPGVGFETINDTIFFQNFIFYAPLHERVVGYVKAFYGYQNELNLVPPVQWSFYVNYVGAECGSAIYLRPHGILETSIRVKQGLRQKMGIFPFTPSTRVEPEARFTYEKKRWTAQFGGGVQSMLIKEVSSSTTRLLALYPLFATLQMQAFPQYSGQVGIQLEQRPQGDGNWRQNYLGYLWTYIPKLSPLFFNYEVYYRKFRYVTPNYFSYSYQYQNAMRAGVDWTKGLFHLTGYYEKAFQFSKNVETPVGNQLFATGKLPLNSSKFYGELDFHIATYALFRGEAYYYWNSFPYAERAFKLSFEWEF